MPLFALIKQNTENMEIQKEKFNLSKYGIFTRGTILDFIKGMIKGISHKLSKGTEFVEIKENMNEKEHFKIFFQTREKMRYFIITDGGYNTGVANKLMGKLFNNESFDILIKEFYVWEDQDHLKKIEDELEKCHVVIMDGLAQVLERGETLSDLVAKSEHLSMQTKILFKTAKKKNSCC
jgi:synaptobrevin family protein YKT6